MNKISKFFLSLLPLLGVLFFVSCEENKVDDKPTEKSVVNLKSLEVNAEAKGGSYSVNYTITNPIEGEIVEVSTDADWVTNFDRTAAGIIKFEVAKNTVEEVREAVVDVNYKNADPVSFTVKQGAASPQNLTFTVDDVELGYRTCLFDVYPADQNTPYLLGIYPMDYIEQYELFDDEALYNDDLEYFAWLGNFYGLTAYDVIDTRKIFGNTYGKEATGCRPATDYLLYMYYINEQTGERISDIHRHNFSTPSVPLQELAFEMSYTIDGPEVNITATAPSGYLDAFYFDVMPKAAVDEGAASLGITTQEYIELWWNNTACDEMDQNYSPEAIINSVGSYMSDSYEVELHAETEYYLFAFSLNEWALCSSVPQVKEFTTGKVEPSDNEITIIVSDVTSCGATIRFRPTIEDDPYVAAWITKEEWKKFGATERERIQNILKSYNFGTDYLYGELSYTEKVGLTPDTEHVVFAFGYRGGVATTGLFYEEFKTLSDAPSTETIELKEMGYFDIYALNEADPTVGNLSFASSYAIYPMEVIKSSDDVIGYTDGFTVTSGNREFYTYEYVMSNMIGNGEAPQYTYRFVEYGMNNLITAVGRDAEGRYTEIWYDYFYCEQSGCNPNVQEFIDWLHSWMGTSAAPASVVYNDEKKEEAPLFTRKAVIESPMKTKFSSKEANDAVVVPAVEDLSAIRK